MWLSWRQAAGSNCGRGVADRLLAGTKQSDHESSLNPTMALMSFLLLPPQTPALTPTGRARLLHPPLARIAITPLSLRPPRCALAAYRAQPRHRDPDPSS